MKSVNCHQQQIYYQHLKTKLIIMDKPNHTVLLKNTSIVIK